MFISGNCPLFKTYVRSRYLHNGDESNDKEFFFGMVCGLSSIPNRAITFTVLFDNGALYSGLPIHALCFKKTERCLPLDFLCLYDAFSYNFSVTEFSFLKSLRVRFLDKAKTWHYGNYMFTIDWAENQTDYPSSTVSEMPDERKSMHMIRLEDGNFALQPNNRMQFFEPSFVVDPFEERPSFKINTKVWSCETESKYRTINADDFFY